MYILQRLKIDLILCHSTKAKSKNWKKADTDSSESMVMPQSRHAIGQGRAFPIREYAIRKSSMESNHTDAFRCLLQFQTASRNANSAGGT